MLIDSASRHISERCLRLLGDNRVLAVAFPAHSSNIFRALDFVCFDALRKLKATVQDEFDDDSINHQITRLVQGSEHTVTSMTIPALFPAAGLIPGTSSRPFCLRFAEEEARENAGFQEICGRTIKIEEFARRRQGQ
jgi:hypothetical protein